MLAAAILTAAPAAAQTSTPTVAAPDPVRLAVAQALIDKFLPADRRDAMVEAMIKPMMDNMRSAMIESPMFEELKAKNPKLLEVMNVFVNGELDRSIATTKAAMPLMLEAMARAYTRRFTLDELKAISAFFDTPAGRAYTAQSTTIMSDPDVLAAQRAMMTQAFSGMQERMESLKDKLEAAAKDDK